MGTWREKRRPHQSCWKIISSYCVTSTVIGIAEREHGGKTGDPIRVAGRLYLVIVSLAL